MGSSINYVEIPFSVHFNRLTECSPDILKKSSIIDLVKRSHRHDCLEITRNIFQSKYNSTVFKLSGPFAPVDSEKYNHFKVNEVCLLAFLQINLSLTTVIYFFLGLSAEFQSDRYIFKTIWRPSTAYPSVFW